MKLKETPKSHIKNHELTEYAENLTNIYLGLTDSNHRKKNEQFFTPKEVAMLMVRQFDNLSKKSKIKILDPGAGIGIFESTICEFLLSKNIKSEILFEIYEKDDKILPFLKKNLEHCKRLMSKKNTRISYNINNSDFILENSFILKENKKLDLKYCFDFIICNPPYQKTNEYLKSNKNLKEIVKNQPNMYTLFMTLASKLLKAGGELTFITPRSYCSGLYFKHFRKSFLNEIKPTRIHIFNSRNKVFKKYNVLQEIIILTGLKTKKSPKKVIISKSEGIPHKIKKLEKRKTIFENVIVKKGDGVIIKVPLSDFEEKLTNKLNTLKFKMPELGIKVSTGRVVPFRSKKFIIKHFKKHQKHYPLIWMQNIQNEKVKWPLNNKKPIAIKKEDGCANLLVPNQNYVLVKRFSAKEGERRICAGVLLNSMTNYEYIGIENHVNYIHKINGNLTVQETYGITALLNSKIYNIYFQTGNGSTQVNAYELETLPLPSLKKIRKIGRLVMKNKKANIDKILANKLNLPYNSNF